MTCLAQDKEPVEWYQNHRPSSLFYPFFRRNLCFLQLPVEDEVEEQRDSPRLQDSPQFVPPFDTIELPLQNITTCLVVTGSNRIQSCGL